ncbi:DUF1217 domain-containing protein [Roseivivax isoporae]|uniref:Flagellar basal-body rod protein FlgF n=1 Tax=Roseivivax isoporae LMG 25204 TaxID=1449351 RepID=X7F9W4_9RHOB|nr:DUF1217 domain-containing protein [Roseivivax isoporae]ETX28901.1 hypothetical protein RISW2_04100 [Roseivivax isoporae LMG 25204]
MIPIGGMTGQTALTLVKATEDRARELIRTSAQHERAISHFRENIADVNSVDDLMADPELYGFVMRAFDLEDQIFGKALMSKMLKSDIAEPDALVNRLSDPRFKELYNALGFGPEGVNTLNTISSRWREEVVDRYVTRQMIDTYNDQNETVGRALDFREKIGGVRNYFDILKDQDLSVVMRTAFGIPDAVAGIDIDRQAEILADKFDLESLKDPEEIDRIMRLYVTLTDARNGVAGLSAGSAAVQMLSTGLNRGGAFTPITIDIAAISARPANPYG